MSAATPADSAGSASSALPETRGADLVVVAERRPAERMHSTVAVEVSDVDDDRRRGHPAAWWQRVDALPGMRALPLYGGVDGGALALSIRGAPTADAQLLLDGIPINDASTPGGDANVALIVPAGLSRIEVAKGAQSGLYGSRAVSGAVELRSLDPAGAPGARGLVETGSGETWRGEAEAVLRPLSWLGIAVAASGLTSRGFSAQSDAGANGDPGDHEADGVQRGTGTLRFSAMLAPGFELRAGAYVIAVNQDLDSFDPIAFTPRPDDRGTRQQARLLRGTLGTRVEVLPSVTLRADMARTLTRRHFRESGKVPYRYDSSEDALSIGVQGRTGTQGEQGISAWAPRGGYGIGGDLRHSEAQVEDANFASDFTARERLIGGFASAAVGFGEVVDADAVVRRDRHDRAGLADTWRLGLVLRPLHLALAVPPRLLSLRMAAGTAFRAPSLFELYDPFSGNPDLKAQRSRTVEGGFASEPVEGVAAGVTWFRTRYLDQIGFSPVFPFTTINVGGPTVRGSEAFLRVDPPGDGLRLNATALFLDDDRGGAALARQARRSHAVEPGLDAGPFSMQLRWSATVSRWYPGSGLPGMQRLDAACTWAFGPSLHAHLRGEDLTDARGEQSPGFSTPGRTLAIGLSAEF